MPSCFQLTDKTTGKPARFIDIDEAICTEYGVAIDPDKYYLGWYDYVGLGLATGSSFNDIRKRLNDNLRRNEFDGWSRDMLVVVDYLDANYTSAAWHESSSMRTR